MKVKTVFEKVIYYSEDNNFAIFKTNNDNLVKGTILHSPEELLKTPLILEGEFEVHEKYGRQFNFKNYSIEISSIEFFLKKIVKTIPEEAINEIIKKYNPFEIKDIIHNNPNELLSIKGIGKKRLSRIVERFTEYEHLINLVEFLAPFGISNYLINVIYDKFKEKSIEILKDNPYKLTKIKGIGFKKADEIGLKLKNRLDDVNRLKSGIIYVVEDELNNNGNTFVYKKDLFKKSQELLKDSEGIYSPTVEDLENILNVLLDEKELITDNYQDNEIIFFPHVFKMEKSIFDITNPSIENWNLGFKKEDIENIIKEYEKNNFSLGSKQKEAVVKFTTTNDSMFILAGYAGSGKTTTSKLILDIYASKIGKSNIVGCALSGNASNRIKNVTGYKAYTIHSLLGFTKEGFTFNKDNPLPFKLIVLDEASMVDVYLFFKLIEAIDFENTKLFLIGDNAQLPPVGYGEIFEDLLNLSDMPKIILDKVYRQKENQVINIFAQSIREGKVPRAYKNKKYEDFEFVVQEIDDYYQKRKEIKEEDFRKMKDENYYAIEQIILDEAKNKKEQLYQFLQNEDYQKAISFFQIISPMKKGILGTENMNLKIKSILNPVNKLMEINKDYIKLGDKVISVNDKVIHLQNKNKLFFSKYERERISNLEEGYFKLLSDQKEIRVFNGQVGIVNEIFQVITDYDEDTGDYETKTIIEVYYPYEDYYIYYTKDEFANRIIDLAYAITIHKSQGSEYENVLMPISFSHFMMLNSKLLYTAVTRAKRYLKIVGETYAFGFACKKKDNIQRNTLYKYFYFLKKE